MAEPARPRSQVVATVAVVALGGAVGTVARYATAELWPPTPRGIPWSTLAINVVGSLALGWFVALVRGRWHTDHPLRHFVAAGVLGGFTTFSTVAVEVDLRVSDGAVGAASVYLALTLMVGLGAAWVGLAAGGAVARRRAAA